MVRKLFCSMLVMTVAVAFVAAEEFNATITAVKDGKVTYQKYKKAEKKGDKAEKDGAAVTVRVGKDAVIAKAKGFGKKAEVGDKIEGGLKHEIFTTKIDENKGVPARITTDGEGDKLKITQILVYGKKKPAAQ